MTWTIIVLAVLALVLWGFYISWRASRLDRLHNRAEAARTALDLALVRRSSAAVELASSGLLDPATSLLLADAARRTRQPGAGDRDLAESDLTRALRATLGDPVFRKELAVNDGAAELTAEVEAAANQVFIARKFYNDVAGRTLDARRRPLARAFRLSGSARQPEFFEMDDVITEGDGRGLPGSRPAARRGHSRSGTGPQVALPGRGRAPAAPARHTMVVRTPLPGGLTVSTADATRTAQATIRGERPVRSDDSKPETGTARVKRGMAEMLKGGVIMDVVTPEQAKIAEEAGAVAVMALERVPADIRVQGGVARMSDPDMIDSIISAVSIPVMAKCRIGHFAEAQVLQAIGVDYIDESEVLTPADEAHHVDKWKFTVPFVCGATNLGEALRRIAEGAAMIRSKGEAGTGNVVEATRHMRALSQGIRRLGSLPPEELFTAAKELAAPYELVAEVAKAGKLPVVMFTAGGIATPADAAMMMQLGAEGVFVGSGIFKSGDPAKRASAIVKATTFFDDPDVVAKVSRGLGEAMVGINIDTLPADQHYAGRGW